MGGDASVLRCVARVSGLPPIDIGRDPPFDSSIGGCQEETGVDGLGKVPLSHCNGGAKWGLKKVENRCDWPGTWKPLRARKDGIEAGAVNGWAGGRDLHGLLLLTTATATQPARVRAMPNGRSSADHDIRSDALSGVFAGLGDPV